MSKIDRFSGLKSLVTFATIDVENVRILSDQGGDGTSEGAKVLLQSISKKQGKKMNFAESGKHIPKFVEFFNSRPFGIRCIFRFFY
ncbi:hypothetical protein I3760_04G147400 [Carya illinoinensis]|nr:hypothetical protein I3760_04G147400 [Carya illinoinensis]